MRVLIAGGSGFLGAILRRTLLSNGHQVKVLTRSAGNDAGAVRWDGRRAGAWTQELEQTDAVVNACGLGLNHWPWTPSRKRQFLESRVRPGRALADAITAAKSRPGALIQFSGINRYGLSGDPMADETTPPASDFLAQLTIPWEDSTRTVEDVGVRRVVVRNAIVLDSRHGLYPLMCLPARLFCGGRLGTGMQLVPWIHVADYVRALLFLLESEDAVGAYNLVAPVASNNAEFMESLCAGLRRPYWLHVPGEMMRIGLGEMADLILRGRASTPMRLMKAGFQFQFPDIRSAANDLLAT
jgi:hypothetical protein